MWLLLSRHIIRDITSDARSYKAFSFIQNTGCVPVTLSLFDLGGTRLMSVDIYTSRPSLQSGSIPLPKPQIRISLYYRIAMIKWNSLSTSPSTITVKHGDF